MIWIIKFGLLIIYNGEVSFMAYSWNYPMSYNSYTSEIELSDSLASFNLFSYQRLESMNYYSISIGDC